MACEVGPGLPGATMEAYAEGFACGQAGILTVTIDDSNGANVLGPTTAGILEIECTVDNFGVYRYLGVFPADPSLSPYVITWEGASGTDPAIDTTASEEICVSADAPSPVSGVGPCEDWITGAEVADCCGDVILSSDNEAALEQVASYASSVLFELSGRIFSGLCGPVTARPCRDNCSCWGFQTLAYASGGSRELWTGWNWGGWWGWNGSHCGCGCLSRVKLSGYPVQGIAQVKIDGAVIAPSEYRLDYKRFLTHKDGGRWPACQDLSLDDDQEGTFSISYWFGETPPPLGVRAAEQLACELYRSCTGAECRLPSGATRITRQGVTIERQFFQRDPLTKAWRTGLTIVDLFLNTYNPSGLIRRPIFWAAGNKSRYAPRIS